MSKRTHYGFKVNTHGIGLYISCVGPISRWDVEDYEHLTLTDEHRNISCRICKKHSDEIVNYERHNP